MDTNLFLTSDTAKALYKAVKALPIIDYHNHLPVAEIARDTRFTDVTALWIAPDPYKHRAMRMMGVPEQKITGDASPREKFEAWCGVFPYLAGNPLYVWSQMELASVFGVVEIPSAANARTLYEKLNAFLYDHVVTPSFFSDAFNVEKMCPCSSVLDNCAVFSDCPPVSPSLRADDCVCPTKPFLAALEACAGMKIRDLDGYKQALEKRVDDMTAAGLVFCDHALDDGFRFYADDGGNGARFEGILAGNTLSDADAARFVSYMLVFLASLYASKRLVLQLHVGAVRHTSSRLRMAAGSAGGYAAVGTRTDAAALAALLNAIERTDAGLPRVVLFPLNPADNAAVSSLAGSFAKDGVRGLVSQGPAWWWCDHRQGITDMLTHTASFGLLANFVGMTTDSRSFLSFVRHDYFRRILCGFLAQKSTEGELPDDMDELTRLAGDLCYRNAKKLFDTACFARKE